MPRAAMQQTLNEHKCGAPSGGGAGVDTVTATPSHKVEVGRPGIGQTGTQTHLKL